MSDDVDDLDAALRRAMASLDRQVPPGYFEALPERTLARLEDPDLGGELGAAPGAAAVEIGEPHDDDSGLKDIRDLANETKARLSSRRLQGAPRPEDELLATLPAAWHAVALPDPARQVQGTDAGVATAAASTGSIAAAASAEEAPAGTVAPTPIGSRRRRNRALALVGVGVGLAAAASAVVFVKASGGDRSAEPSGTAAAMAPSSSSGSAAAPAVERERSERAAAAAAPPKPAAPSAVASSATPHGASASASASGALDVVDDTRGKFAAPASKRPATSAQTARPEPPDKPANGKRVSSKTGKPLSDPWADDRIAAGPAPAAQSTGVGGGVAGSASATDSSSEDLRRGSARSSAGSGSSSEPPPLEELIGAGDGPVTKSKAGSRTGRTALSADDIKRGMTAVAGKVQTCFAGTQGTALLRLTVAPSGRVTRATVSGMFAATPVGGCVERVVRTATFPPWDGGPQSFGYSYLLSD